jgi:hypothetical protein
MATTYERIASTTLTSASTISFTSIPQTYTDLIVVVTGYNATSGNAWVLRFNSDTASNYSQTSLSSDGSTASSGRNSNLTYGYYGDSINNNSYVTPNTATVNIFSYTNTNVFKSWSSNCNSNQNGNGDANIIVGTWRSTSAITTILLTNDGGGNYQIGTVASLYGIKAA